jgi:hypothetical protein
VSTDVLTGAKSRFVAVSVHPATGMIPVRARAMKFPFASVVESKLTPFGQLTSTWALATGAPEALATTVPVTE